MVKIGFDLDNVLAHTNQHFIDYLQQEGRCLGFREEEMRHHRLEVCYPEQVTDAWLNARFGEADFWATIPPMRALVQATARCFVPRDIELHIVTARFLWQHPQIESLTREWLQGCNVWYTHLALVEAAAKADYAVQEGLSLFVEDRGDTAQQLASRGIPVLLAAFPYNEPTMHGVTYHPLIKRMPRAEIAHAVQAFARGRPFAEL